MGAKNARIAGFRRTTDQSGAGWQIKDPESAEVGGVKDAVIPRNQATTGPGTGDRLGPAT